MKKVSVFTLLELLIVVAIMIIMISMSLPGLRQAKAMAQRIKCESGFKQIGFAEAMYFSDYNNWFPFAYVEGGDNDGYCDRDVGAWFVGYAPFLNVPYYGYQSLGASYPGLDKPCIFTCPAQSFTYPTKRPVSYAILNNLAYEAPIISSSPVIKRPRLENIRNPSKKLFLVDSITTNFVKVSRISEDTGELPNGFFAFRHNIGSNILFFDGHCGWRKKLDLIAAYGIYTDLFYPFHD